MKKVIYTCIVGNYDNLPQPLAVDGSFEYICFTNEISGGRAGVWQIRPIPYSDDDMTRLSRYVKLQPHRVLADFDVSVWIDGNVRITDGEFYRLVDGKVESGALMAQVQHPQRDCVYEEISKCYRDVRISLSDALKQRERLEREDFPRHYGLMENNLIFRRHNDPTVVRISDAWWNAYLDGSVRDQFCLMPVFRRLDFRPELLLGEGRNVRNVTYLEIVKHSGVPAVSGLKGLKRMRMKILWTFRRIVAALFLG